MKSSMLPSLFAAVIAVTALSGGAAARGETDMFADGADLKRYCASFGGRFEQGWRYDDGGVRWGARSACFLPAGRVVCQDGVCRSFRHDMSRPEMVVASAEFRATASFVAAALSNLGRP